MGDAEGGTQTQTPLGVRAAMEDIEVFYSSLFMLDKFDKNLFYTKITPVKDLYYAMLVLSA